MPPIPPTKGQIRTMIRASVPSSGAIAFIGDSLTNDVAAAALGPQEWHFWAHALSGGRLQHAGKFGASGLGLLTTASNGSTWAQAMAGLLALSPRPAYACVLIGVNDLEAGGKSFAQVKAALIAASTTIRNNGMIPILCTLFPSNHTASDSALRLKYHTFNTWVTYYARRQGYPMVDFYSGLTNGSNGDWTGGYNRDSIHPNPVGARAAGQMFATAFAAGFPWTPYLACDNGDGTTILNPLMLTDALTNGSSGHVAADGIPDSWGKANTMPVGIINELIDAGADAIGNWYHQNRNGITSGGPILRSSKVLASVGDLIEIGFRLKIAADTGNLTTGVTVNQYSAQTLAAASVGSLWLPINVSTGLEFDLEPSTLYHVATCTAASTTSVGCDVQTGPGDGELWLGQFTLRNLTALGVL